MTVHTAYLYLNHPTICVIKLCGMILGCSSSESRKALMGSAAPQGLRNTANLKVIDPNWRLFDRS
jgi:hypothetical protein